MAYSCTDFTDDVLNDPIMRGWIERIRVKPEDTQGQATLVLGAIAEADKTLQLAADAKQFHIELLGAVETLTGVEEQYGALTLAYIVYLQMAIVRGTSIEVCPDFARKLSFVRALPSGERWWKHVIELAEPA